MKKFLALLLSAVMLIVSVIAGGVWGLIPGVFKARWGTNETLFTLMMNYVAIQLTSYAVSKWENPAGSNSVGIINQTSRAGWIPSVFGQAYTLNVVIVLALAVLMYIYLKYSKQGYEISVVGDSENTARYAGINVKKVYIRTMSGNVDLLIAAEPAEVIWQEKEEQKFQWQMEPFAIDALVFVVNADNPVDSLTTEQIQKIYTGEITNWSEVGGDDLDIVPFQRNEEAGSQTAMAIDGNSILNRAYYGIRPLSTRDGLYTHAIYGFLTTLLRLRDEEQPDAVCVAFDLHAPTFRHKADENYKATRKPMPEELRMQVPVLKEVLDALNIPRYEAEGWEADDWLGTISRRCEAAGWDCVVVTGDKDSLQLITEKTKVKLVSTRMWRPLQP